MAVVGPDGPRGPANITQSVVLRFNLLEVNPKPFCACPVPVCLLPGSETGGIMYKPRSTPASSLAQWGTEEQFCCYFWFLNCLLLQSHRKSFSHHAAKQISNRRPCGKCSFFFFFSFPDSGPSNQLHLRSGGGASSLTHPNSYLPVQLMAYLLLPWLGRKSWTRAGSICLKYHKCLCGCSGVDATNIPPPHSSFPCCKILQSNWPFLPCPSSRARFPPAMWKINGCGDIMFPKYSLRGAECEAFDVGWKVWWLASQLPRCRFSGRGEQWKMEWSASSSA